MPGFHYAYILVSESDPACQDAGPTSNFLQRLIERNSGKAAPGDLHRLERHLALEHAIPRAEGCH